MGYRAPFINTRVLFLKVIIAIKRIKTEKEKKDCYLVIFYFTFLKKLATFSRSARVMQTNIYNASFANFTLFYGKYGMFVAQIPLLYLKGKRIKKK